MDKHLAGLIGAVGALAVAGPAHAAVSAPASLDEVMRIDSYADLLKPIPNAMALRKTMVETQEAAPSVTPEIMTVQYYRDHHHHHHQYYRRRFHHHHHHHHHHHGFFR